MTADLPQPEQDVLAKAWWNMHERVAKLSTRGENRLVRDTGHMVPYERPQAIIDAVTTVVEQTRNSAVRWLIR